MKQPGIILDLEKPIEQLINRRVQKQRESLLKYILVVLKAVRGGIKGDLLSVEYEKVTNYSINVYTVRYDGDLIFREYNIGSFPNPESKKRYESPYLKS